MHKIILTSSISISLGNSHEINKLSKEKLLSYVSLNNYSLDFVNVV